MFDVSQRAAPQLLSEGIQLKGAFLAPPLFYLAEGNTHQNRQIEGIAVDPLQILLSDLAAVVRA